jgi:hypothetical protein
MASLAALFHPRRQDEFHLQRDIKGLDRTGSWLACILAIIAAFLLIFSACAMNASHAWAFGMVEGPFRAIVLACASIGAAILAPLGFLSVARGKGFGTRLSAFLLAIGCLAYTSASSLGFIATAKDANVSGRSAVIEAHQDRRALIADARKELAGLKGQRQEVIERRAELTDLLAKLIASATAQPAKAPDAQAAALAFYIRAAGWQVDDRAVSTWMSLAMVLILEAGAALSLTVAAALRPERVGRLYGAVPASLMPDAPNPADRPVRASGASAGASQKKDGDDDDQPTLPNPRGKGGRPAAILPGAAVTRLRKGKANGSIRGVAKLLGTSKSTAHRMLHQLARLGMIRLSTSPAGVSVALMR